jgi:hypothetical protein
MARVWAWLITTVASLAAIVAACTIVVLTAWRRGEPLDLFGLRIHPLLVGALLPLAAIVLLAKARESRSFFASLPSMKSEVFRRFMTDFLLVCSPAWLWLAALVIFALLPAGAPDTPLTITLAFVICAMVLAGSALLIVGRWRWQKHTGR